MSYSKMVIAPVVGTAAPKSDGLRERLQQKCSDWGTYWRAPDAHGVVLTKEQAWELLCDALGVEVEITTPQPPPAAVPACPECSAPGLLYECPACSASNYPAAPAGQGADRDAIETIAYAVLERIGGPPVALKYDAEDASDWIVRASSEYRNQRLVGPAYQTIELVDRAALASDI